MSAEILQLGPNLGEDEAERWDCDHTWSFSLSGVCIVSGKGNKLHGEFGSDEIGVACCGVVESMAFRSFALLSCIHCGQPFLSRRPP